MHTSCAGLLFRCAPNQPLLLGVMCNKKMQLPNYETDHYELDNGEEIHNEYPESFWIPSRVLRENLQAGDLVKLIFRMEEKENQDDVSVERMWVEIKDKNGLFYTGNLDNDPNGEVLVKCGVSVNFKAEHIIEIYEEENTE